MGVFVSLASVGVADNPFSYSIFFLVLCVGVVREDSPDFLVDEYVKSLSAVSVPGLDDG